MTLYVCDRCRATRPQGLLGIYASGDGDEKHLFQMQVPGVDGEAAYDPVELCDDCVRALHRWLRREEVNNEMTGSITADTLTIIGDASAAVNTGPWTAGGGHR